MINDQGELVAETKLDSEVTDLVAWLDDLGRDITQVGLEAGTLCQYLTYGLQRLDASRTDCKEERDPRQDATNNMTQNRGA